MSNAKDRAREIAEILLHRSSNKALTVNRIEMALRAYGDARVAEILEKAARDCEQARPSATKGMSSDAINYSLGLQHAAGFVRRWKPSTEDGKRI